MNKNKKPVLRKKTIVKNDDRPQEMIVGDKTYTVGDVAWYVDEYTKLARPKALQADITNVYPEDNLEPALGVREHASGKHRAIRARLCGWTKKEAKENYISFLKSEEKKNKKLKKK